jgi:hypothetical protein
MNKENKTLSQKIKTYASQPPLGLGTNFSYRRLIALLDERDTPCTLTI